MTNLFVGACLLFGALSARVPPLTPKNSPQLDTMGSDDRMVEFHLQVGLVDKSWILFDSGACASRWPEWGLVREAKRICTQLMGHTMVMLWRWIGT